MNDQIKNTYPAASTIFREARDLIVRQEKSYLYEQALTDLCCVLTGVDPASKARSVVADEIRRWGLEAPLDVYPQSVVHVIITNEDDDGAQYTLVYPDGTEARIGNNEEAYSDLAGIIDTEYREAKRQEEAERAKAEREAFIVESEATASGGGLTVADLAFLSLEERMAFPLAVDVNGLVIRFNDVRNAEMYAWLMDAGDNTVQRYAALAQAEHQIDPEVRGWRKVTYFVK